MWSGKAEGSTRIMAGDRPAHVKPPAHLSKSPPVPEPGRAVDEEESDGRKGAEPTRYGDWESKGICRDF
jgi:hypothetical protein